MKKNITVLFIIMMLLSTTGLTMAQDTIFKIGSLNEGDYSISKSSGDEEKTLEKALYLGVESALEVNESFELGYGGGLVLSNSFQDDSGDLTCLQCYLLLNYYPSTIEGLPYLTGHLGYNSLSTDDEYDASMGGLYYAVGAGMRTKTYPNLRLEVLYMVNNASGTTEESVFGGGGVDLDVTSSRISLNLGIGF